MVDDDRDDFIPDPPEPTKYCPKCNRNLPLTDFFKRNKSKNTLAGYCKKCHSKRAIHRNERIVCPHCKGRIFFCGVDTHGKVVRQHSQFVKRIRMDTVHKLNKLRKRKIKKTDLKAIFARVPNED